jgi:hypothetical protein
MVVVMSLGLMHEQHVVLDYSAGEIVKFQLYVFGLTRSINDARV